MPTIRNLASALQDSPSLAIIMDTEGRIQFANAACERVLGYSLAEMSGERPRSIASPRQNMRSWEDQREELREGRPVSTEISVLSKAGEEVHLRVSLFVLEGEEGESHWVGIGDDITQVRALEDQVRSAQKLEAVGQFIGGVAHDFNNILAAILTNAQLLEMGMPDGSLDAEEVADIIAASRRGAELVRKLMLFSRKGDLEPGRVEVQAFLKDTGDFLSRVIPENIELVVLPPDEPLYVWADMGALEQVLVNLATNAADAMPRGGILELRAAPDAHPLPFGADALVLQVRDTGTGMDAETARKVFEPFFSTKPRSRGSGLGLSVVYGIVGSMGGQISVESALGEGTTFTLRLPLHPGGEAAPAAGSVGMARTPGGSRASVLLAEDEGPLRRAAVRALEKLGFQVIAAADGTEAIELLDRHRDKVDIVVSDMIMPGASGTEVYDSVRDWEDRPPFVFTSGYSAETWKPELYPGVRFLRKPWDVDQLLSAVRAALGPGAP